VLYRTFVGVVIVFWAVMTSLLVRLELQPEHSSFLNIPVSHVFNLMFFHQQRSVLSIYESGERIGSLSVQPRTLKDRRELEIAGNISFALPWTTRQRVGWNGVIRMDRKLDMQFVELALRTREPEVNTRLSVDVLSNSGSYEVRGGDGTIQSASFSLNELPIVAEQVGFRLAMLNNARPVVTARQTDMQIAGDKIEVYSITIAQKEMTLAQIFVSPLGQILKVNTSFGYSLSAEDVFP
jgi:hypothetical protein